jgi:hypothetical protein
MVTLDGLSFTVPSVFHLIATVIMLVDIPCSFRQSMLAVVPAPFVLAAVTCMPSCVPVFAQVPFDLIFTVPGMSGIGLRMSPGLNPILPVLVQIPTVPLPSTPLAFAGDAPIVSMVRPASAETAIAAWLIALCTLIIPPRFVSVCDAP